MKIKVIFYTVLFFPIILIAQNFPTPPSQSQINNQMMGQQQNWQLQQQHQQMMRMLNNIQTNEQKLEREKIKKTNRFLG